MPQKREKMNSNQCDVAQLYEDIGDRWVEPTPLDAWAWLITEAGELGDVMMRLGYGGRDDYSRNNELVVNGHDLEHELGDTYLMLCELANLLDLDLSKALDKRITYYYTKYMRE